MGDIENMAMKIFYAYEDFYLDKDKSKIFEDLFDRYLLKVHDGGQLGPYEAIVALGYRHSDEFHEMVRILKEQSLISD